MFCFDKMKRKKALFRTSHPTQQCQQQHNRQRACAMHIYGMWIALQQRKKINYI